MLGNAREALRLEARERRTVVAGLRTDVQLCLPLWQHPQELPIPLPTLLFLETRRSYDPFSFMLIVR